MPDGPACIDMVDFPSPLRDLYETFTSPLRALCSGPSGMYPCQTYMESQGTWMVEVSMELFFYIRIQTHSFKFLGLGGGEFLGWLKR